MVKLQKNVSKDGLVKWSVTMPALIVKKKKWVKGQELIVSYNQDGDVVFTDTK